MKHSKTVLDHISKHLEVRQKYSAARRIFNSLLGVWKCGQTRSFVFDIFSQAKLKLRRKRRNNIVKIYAKLRSDIQTPSQP